MAAASLPTFSSLSLHHSSRRFSVLSPFPITISLSPAPSSLYFPLSLSPTKFNCTPDEITPVSISNESEDPAQAPAAEDQPEELEEEEEEQDEDFSTDFIEPRVYLDPLTATKDEIAAAYERLYGPAYSGVTLLKKDVYEMDKKLKANIGFGSEKKERIRDKFDEQVIQVRRVTKVVKGGKKMNFRAIVVVGNKKGKVGVGHGKATEILSAVQKAAYDARRNLIDVPMTKHMTFPHRADGKYGAAEVMLRPACPGTGVIAGGAVRTVLELAGLQNALGKQLRSKNALNNARATVYAILKMRQFSEVSADRGIPIEEMFK